MKIKQILAAILIVTASATALASFQPTIASAAQDDGLKCTVLPQNICDSADDKSGQVQKSGVWAILLLILNIMTALVGVVAVGALGFAGILYATARDDNSQLTRAKTMLRNTVIGIILYGMMFVLLNYLVPGGVFKA